MNDNHKAFISFSLSLIIVGFSIYIIHRFIPSIVWAAVIAIATYPLYLRWRRWFGGHRNIAAFSFTALLSLVLFLPLLWLLSLLITECQLFINYLHTINRHGGEAPYFFHEVPFVKDELIAYWDKLFGEPGSVRRVLSQMHLSLTPLSHYVKQVGVNVLHRGFQFGFTLLTLFFFYRDGDHLIQQIHHIGEIALGQRWGRYADRLPSALRGTVNGTIVVGIGVGVLMGFCYGLVGLSTPALTGFITAVAAMIPFVVPFVFAVVALVLFAGGNMAAAVVVVIWGTIVMFIADHFVKPVMIGGAIQLPFLAVLFGILGGVETLGLLGLFVGPIAMVLFLTLWQESQISQVDPT